MTAHVLNGVQVDVYPVGVLAACKYRRYRPEFDRLKYQLRRRNWRAIRNGFNGYLAEPCDWPYGLTRCGSGWTKRRALADLKRRMDREVTA